MGKQYLPSDLIFVNTEVPFVDANLKLLTARLDLALGFARLASHFHRIGNYKEYSEQLGHTRKQYELILHDWTEFDAEGNPTLREKRRGLEECFEKLMRGEHC